MATKFLRPTLIFHSEAAKECHCERSEPISPLWGLPRRFTPRNDKSRPVLTEELQIKYGSETVPNWAAFLIISQFLFTTVNQ
jgi:hypothetical protein